MNDNDIIKTLECCEKHGKYPCDNFCPMFYNGTTTRSDCRRMLHENALDLINRQKAEIERLNTNMDAMVSEHKRLIVNAKTEAIKEFAERLCDGKVSNDPVVIAVKCAVKEMTEDTK